MIVFSLSGCALSEYLKGNVPSGDNETSECPTCLNDEEDTAVDEIDKVLEEVDKTVAEEKESEVKTTDNKTIAEEVDEEDFIKISVKEKEKVKLKPKAKDADEDIITYTFSEPLDKNGEWQTDYGDAGNYLITVTASDGKLKTTKKVLLTVERVNVPPVISGVGAELKASEGETLKLPVKVSDPNGDRVTVTFSKPFDKEGSWKIGYTDRGIYNVTVTATDGEKKSIKSFKLIVAKKNMPPTIEKIQDVTINEGDKIELKPVVDDLNKDELTVKISEPIGNDGVWETTYTSHGVYEIKVTASDGTATTTEMFKLIVKDINRAPEIIEVTN